MNNQNLKPQIQFYLNDEQKTLKIIDETFGEILKLKPYKFTKKKLEK